LPKLEELYTFFDPHGQFPALQNAVVIAHSMGGLLTQTAVSDSGDQLWERTFQKAPAGLELSAALREQLARLLRFHRAPSLKEGCRLGPDEGLSTGVFFALVRRIDAARNTTANP